MWPVISISRVIYVSWDKLFCTWRRQTYKLFPFIVPLFLPLVGQWEVVRVGVDCITHAHSHTHNFKLAENTASSPYKINSRNTWAQFWKCFHRYFQPKLKFWPFCFFLKITEPSCLCFCSWLTRLPGKLAHWRRRWGKRVSPQKETRTKTHSLGELVQSVLLFDVMECSFLWLSAEGTVSRPLLLLCEVWWPDIDTYRSCYKGMVY